MKHKIYTMFLLVLNASALFSQTNFEKIYYMGDLSIGFHIIETSDNNFLFASGGHQGGSHSYFVKIDQKGNIIWKNDYFVSTLGSGVWVKEIKGNKYLLLSEEAYFDPVAVAFRKVEGNGFLKWTYKYPDVDHDPPYPQYRANSLEQGWDSSFVSIGYTDMGASGSKCHIISVSKNGTFNWYKEILGTLNLQGLRINKTRDSGYIVLANYTNELSSELIKLSSKGDVIWNKKLNNFTGNTIIIDSKNNFLLGGTGMTSKNKSTPVLLKYSFVGKSMWSVSYPNTTTKNIISYSMIMNNSNKFSFAVKSEKVTSDEYFAVVLNTDSLLNIFSTDTVNLTKTNNCGWGGLSISNISGGGYCLIGTIDSIDIPNPRTFVKVSHNTASSNTKIQSSSFKIFPNPTNGIFQIINNLPENELFQFEIYDVRGQRRWIKEIGREKNITIDCSELSSGIYFYHVLGGNQISKANKIIILK